MADTGRERGVIRRRRGRRRRNLGGRLCPGISVWLWVAACRSKCLSKPNLLSFVSLASLSNSMLGLHQDQGRGKLGTGQMGEQSTWRAKILPVTVAARLSQASPRVLGPSKSSKPPLWNACPVPVCVRVCVLVLARLPVPVDGSREEPRPEAQRSSRRGPSPSSRRSRAASTECQAKSGQVMSKTSLPRLERGREAQGDGRGAVHPGQ